MTLKVGDYTFYLSYIVLGQIVPARNSPKNIENYVYQENEVKLYMPVYNTETGHFKGVRNWLAFIMVRGDKDETFFFYLGIMKKNLKFFTLATNRSCLTYSRGHHLTNMI